jgi:hypothetical protein
VGCSTGHPALDRCDLYVEVNARYGRCGLLTLDLAINQHDLTERTQQVAQMEAVYDYAESIIVWLEEPRNPMDQDLVFLAGSVNVDYPDVCPTPTSAQYGKVVYWTHIWVIQRFLLYRTNSLDIWLGEDRSGCTNFSRVLMEGAFGDPNFKIPEFQYGRGEGSLSIFMVGLKGGWKGHIFLLKNK